LKVHCAIYASGEVLFLTRALLERLFQKFAKSPILIWCQTSASGAAITQLSRTPEEVGILDMMLEFVEIDVVVEMSVDEMG
jgi:hypothetical protein